MKRISHCILLLCILVGTSNCKKYLSINSDPANPQVLGNNSIFPAMLSYLANNYNPGNVGAVSGVQQTGIFIGKYVQFWCSSTAGGDVWDQMGNAPGAQATPSNRYGGEIWTTAYQSLGKNLDYIIQNGLNDNQFDYIGAAYALKAYTYMICTDTYGDIIFSALNNSDATTLPYDSQQTVYQGIDSLCRLSINYLDRAAEAGNSNMTGSDVVYSGNISHWKKFVYGILAHTYNHQSNKTVYTSNNYADSVIKFCDASFQNGDDDFLVPFTGSVVANSNAYGPLSFKLSGQSYSTSTGTSSYGSYICKQSKFIVNLLDGTTLAGGTSALTVDPRISHMLSVSADRTTGSTNGGYRGIVPTAGDPNGTTSRSSVPFLWGDSVYTPSTTLTGKYIFKNNAVCPIMTYSELQFIKAEAAFKTGNLATAYTAYMNGITGHFAFINRTSFPMSNAVLYNGRQIAASDINQYLAGSNVKQMGEDLTLSDIMLQKYIALWGWGAQETWADMRRYHYNTNVSASAAAPFTYLAPEIYKNWRVPSIFSENANKLTYKMRPNYFSEQYNPYYVHLAPNLSTTWPTTECWFSSLDN